jgi:hypothetical protein
MLKASLRSFLAHKGRLALAGLAVVLSGPCRGWRRPATVPPPSGCPCWDTW